jgi:hypothetical protein
VQLAFRIMGLAGRMLFILGAFCLLLGAWLTSRSVDFNEDSVRTTGRVVSHREIRDGDSLWYRPQVRFKTLRGDIVTIAGQLATPSKRFEIGAEVPVMYPSAEPMKGRLVTFTDTWLSAIVAGGVGVITLVAGIFIRRAVRREAARANS